MEDNQTPLTLKYRPRRFDQVTGNVDAVTVLRGLAATKNPRAILIYGPTGTGKTLLSNIYAHSVVCKGKREFGCEPCGGCGECENWDSTFSGEFGNTSIRQVSAADFTNSDQAINSMISDLDYSWGPFIINEIDRFKNLQSIFLQRLERQIKHSIIFTTTNIEAIDSQFKGRCTIINTHRLDDQQMSDYLRMICKKEGFTADDRMIHRMLEKLAGQDSKGQVRDALNLLEQYFAVNEVNKFN